MIQPDLFGPSTADETYAMGNEPKARRTDPQTSWDAARSVDFASETQRWILGQLKGGPMTDEHLIRNHNLSGRATVSPSGLRTRRKELVERGLVIDSGETGLTRSGRKTIKWRLA